MFDTLGMDSILNNQGPAQALADGLMELSKEGSVSILLKKEKQERKKKKKPNSAQILSLHFLTFYQFTTLGHSPSEKLHQFIKAATERFWAQDVLSI